MKELQDYCSQQHHPPLHAILIIQASHRSDPAGALTDNEIGRFSTKLSRRVLVYKGSTTSRTRVIMNEVCYLL